MRLARIERDSRMLGTGLYVLRNGLSGDPTETHSQMNSACGHGRYPSGGISNQQHIASMCFSQRSTNRNATTPAREAR